MIAKLSYVEKLGDADEFCQAHPQHEGERTEFILYDLSCFPFAINCNGARLFQTQQVDTRKASFQWLDQAKRKQENNVWLFYLHPERHNKRAEFFL